jgi:hypothetical protein
MAVGDVCRPDATYTTPKGPLRVRFCGPSTVNIAANGNTASTTAGIILSNFGSIYIDLSTDGGQTYTANPNRISNSVVFALGNGSPAPNRVLIAYTATSPRDETTEIFRCVISPNATIPSPYAGTTSSNPIQTLEGSSAIKGTGTMSATGQLTRVREGAASIKGTGRLTATGTVTTVRETSAAIKGTGRMTATGTVTTVRQASASLTGAGRLGATGTVQKVVQETSAALSGTGRLTAVGQVQKLLAGAANLRVAGNLRATGALVEPLQAAATLAGTGNVQAEGFVERELTVEITAGVVLEANGELILAPPPPRRAPDPVAHVITTRQLVDVKIHPVSD